MFDPCRDAQHHHRRETVVQWSARLHSKEETWVRFLAVSTLFTRHFALTCGHSPSLRSLGSWFNSWWGLAVDCSLISSVLSTLTLASTCTSYSGIYHKLRVVQWFAFVSRSYVKNQHTSRRIHGFFLPGRRPPSRGRCTSRTASQHHALHYGLHQPDCQPAPRPPPVRWSMWSHLGWWCSTMRR